MKKIVLLLTFFLFSFEASADCDLKNIGIDKNFSELKERFKLDDDYIGDDKYYKNTRGKYICSELEGSEVSFLFLKDRLVQIDIYRKSSSYDLLAILSKNFGEPKRKPNEQDNRVNAYTNLWNLDDKIITYNFSLIVDKNLYAQKLLIQSKDKADDISKLFSKEEDQPKKDEKKKDGDGEKKEDEHKENKKD